MVVTIADGPELTWRRPTARRLVHSAADSPHRRPASRAGCPCHVGRRPPLVHVRLGEPLRRQRQPTHRQVSSGPSAIVTTIQTCSRSGRLAYMVTTFGEAGSR